jgi:photosystem II stability/assembly factor-like uncharacterized protein
MKSAFHLTIVIAVLVAMPIVSCASGNLNNGSSQSSTASTATVHLTSVTTVQPAMLLKPLVAIRMLDTMHGWALTNNSVLKTEDGGVSWQDVTPSQTFGLNIQGEFLTTQTAWVVWQSTRGLGGQNQSITILHTSDGGASWQTTTIDNVTGFLVDPPRFINTQEGWLVATQPQGMYHALMSAYQTTNGGQTWTNISGLVDTREVVGGSGISFSNAQLGWAGLEWPGDYPMIEKTEDGGHTWQPQSLPDPPNASSVGNVQTTPAILIGTSGLLPAHITSGPNAQVGLDIYTTHDSGNMWTAGALANFDSNDVYALDIQHVWAEETQSNVLHFSNDGGKTWVQLPQTPAHFDALSFVDTQNGWAIDDAGHLYRTTNGGVIWLLLGTGKI